MVRVITKCEDVELGWVVEVASVFPDSQPPRSGYELLGLIDGVESVELSGVGERGINWDEMRKVVCCKREVVVYEM